MFVVFQITILVLQRRNPRILVPNSVNFGGDNYHRYQTDFEDDAVISTNSLLTDRFLRQNQEQALTDPENAKLEKVYKRLQKL